VLSDIKPFSNLIVQLPLREYQLDALRPVIRSTLERDGREYLLIFPRQAGKNEAVAQMLTYLLNIYQFAGGSIVYGAIANQLHLGIDRLDDRLVSAVLAAELDRLFLTGKIILGTAHSQVIQGQDPLQGDVY
jgi:hypothetical protein